MKFVSTVLLGSLLSSPVFADPKFVADLAEQIQSGMKSGAILSPQRATNWFQTKCRALSPDVEAALRAANQYPRGGALTTKAAFYRTYNANVPRLKNTLRIVQARVQQSHRSMTASLAAHQKALTVARYGTHCDWNLVNADVQQALIDSRYIGANVKPNQVEFSKYWESATQPNRSDPKETDLFVILKWGSDFDRCLLDFVSALESADIDLVAIKKNADEEFRQRDEAKKDAEFARRQTIEERRIGYPEIQDRLFAEVVRKIQPERKKSMIFQWEEEFKSIVGMEFWSASESGNFHPEEQAPEKLAEITRRLRDLRSRAQASYDEMGFGKKYIFGVPYVAGNVGSILDPERRRWSFNTSDLGKSVRPMLYRENRVPEEIEVSIHRQDTKNPLTTLGVWCSDLMQGKETWVAECWMRGYGEFLAGLDKTIASAEAAQCAVDERAHKDDEQFRGTIGLVQASLIKRPKK